MLIVEDKPKSVAAEAYRSLRTSIVFSSFDGDMRKIMVTSAFPGDGKTTTLCNLAVAFAQSGENVIVVDGDMRKPRVHKQFNVSNIFGLSDVLVGEVPLEDAVKVYSDNIHVLNCGTIPPNPAEMVSSRAMEDLLEELCMRYKYVLIDSPPVLPVADATVLSTLVDGTILVAASGESDRKGVKKAFETIQGVKGKVIGTVVTKHKASKVGYNQYYAYYGECDAETTT